MIPSNLIGCAFAFACKYGSKNLWDLWLLKIRETNGIDGFFFSFQWEAEVMVWVAFVKKKKTILNGPVSIFFTRNIQIQLSLDINVEVRDYCSQPVFYPASWASLGRTGGSGSDSVSKGRMRNCLPLGKTKWKHFFVSSLYDCLIFWWSWV